MANCALYFPLHHAHRNSCLAQNKRKNQGSLHANNVEYTNQRYAPRIRYTTFTANLPAFSAAASTLGVQRASFAAQNVSMAKQKRSR
jgi:hypothetical protein